MKIRMLAFAVPCAVLLLLAACSKVTQENYAKIHSGMTEQEVAAILGNPTESTSSSLLGISGTNSKWVGGGAEITIRFVGGKVLTRDFQKPAGRPAEKPAEKPAAK
jgi:hypothetical protein